jgi:hypothetical protein
MCKALIWLASNRRCVERIGARGGATEIARYYHPQLPLGALVPLARISQTSTGIACRYSAFESEINVLQPFDLQSKEDSLL